MQTVEEIQESREGPGMMATGWIGIEGEICTLSRQGLTINEIQERVGWGRKSISRTLRRNRVPVTNVYCDSIRVREPHTSGRAAIWDDAELRVIDSAPSRVKAVALYREAFPESTRTKNAIVQRWSMRRGAE